MAKYTEYPVQPWPLYKQISSLLWVLESRNIEKDEAIEQLRLIEKEELPSGSGFDAGTKIDLIRSNPEKLVFFTQFHHMDENGSYTGWTQHMITVTPSFDSSLKVQVNGSYRNAIREYIADEFHSVLSREV